MIAPDPMLIAGLACVAAVLSVITFPPDFWSEAPDACAADASDWLLALPMIG